MSKSLAKFKFCDAGLAAVEFAVALPLLLVVLLGFFEFDRYVTMTRKLETTAASIAGIITQSQSGIITPVDVTFAQDATVVLFPAVLADSVRKGVSWSNDIAISMSSIVFSKANPTCSSNCSYNAQVAWSSGPKTASRPCNTLLQPVPDAQQPSPTTLASDAFGPVPVMAVDLSFNYTPLFAASLMPPLTIKRSAFMQPRYTMGAAYLKYSVAGGDSLVTTCPGF
jgi:Flp pilus assembly protein TadG